MEREAKLKTFGCTSQTISARSLQRLLVPEQFSKQRAVFLERYYEKSLYK